MPSWAPYLLVAVIPALIVGALVYFLAGKDDGGDGSAVGILDGFIRLGPSSDDAVFTYEGQMPPNFPGDFPTYAGARPVVSFAIGGDEGTSYFAVLGTSATPDQVYNFYLEALDKEPYQVEIARSGDDFTGMRFARPDNPDVSGDVTIHRSEIDNRTAIYLSYQDLGEQTQANDRPFVAGESRKLPPGFPSDIPVYESSESVVVDTYIQKGAGASTYIITFLTKDSQVDVLDFYRQDFQKRGWTVTDSEQESSSFALGIDFSDGQRQAISGSVTADTFEDDGSYTRVDLLLQVSASRSRGN
jgi:hypothetical protein